MSTYFKHTKHPDIGEFERALWMDDYFSHHHYGVKFKDGQIFDPQKVKLETQDIPDPPDFDFIKEFNEFGIKV